MKELRAAGKGLRDATRSKKQLSLVQRQAEQRAARYKDVRRRRGVESARQKRKLWRAGFDEARNELDRVKFEHLASSHAVTAKSNTRRVALTARECSLLIPELHAAAAKVAAVRGSIFKAAKIVKLGKAKLAADKSEKQTDKARLARKRPRNASELRRCSDDRPEQREPARQQPARKKRGATVVEEESEDEESEEEYAGEEEEDDEEEPHPPSCTARVESKKEETEEERAQKQERRRRAELIKKLRAEAKELRARLNELRSGEKRPTEPWKLKEFMEKLPLYEELKDRLQAFDR